MSALPTAEEIVAKVAADYKIGALFEREHAVIAVERGRRAVAAHLAPLAQALHVAHDTGQPIRHTLESLLDAIDKIGGKS